MLSLALSFLGLLAGADGVRMKRASTTTKFIANVPVLNYDRVSSDAVLSEGASAVERDWVVVLGGDVTTPQIEGLCKVSKYGCKIAGSPSEGGVPFLDIRGTEADLEAVLVSAGGAAKFVEPDEMVNFIPDDEQGEEWEEEFGAFATPYHLKNIGADRARSSTGKGVNVYVMDTGVRTTHTELGGRAVPAMDITSGSAVECNGDLSCAADVRGHGTHCAGLVGSNTYGVATGANILGVKVLSDKGAAPWSTIIGAFDWVARKRMRPAVASASLGGPGVENGVKVAVDAAVAAGVTVVVAAGNSGNAACTRSPAHVPSAITVGATTTTNKKAWFTCRGECVDIWAPGTKIKSLSPSSDTKLTEKSGTSQATPLVAGAAALLLEASPSSSPSSITKTIFENSLKGYMLKLGPGDPDRYLWITG